MKLNVVLFEPEIPQNTGNIMRSCVGFEAKLHLIKPYGFTLDEKHLKRARLDYFKYLDYAEYDCLSDFLQKNPNGDYYILSRYGHQSPKEIDFSKCEKDIYLIFGKESTGLPYEFIANNINKTFRIPTTDKVRSLNLSNCVAIMLYLASSSIDNPHLLSDEPDSLKGKFFIDQFKKE